MSWMCIRITSARHSNTHPQYMILWRNIENYIYIFYGLPKIHKSKTISEKCKLANSSYVEVQNVNDLKV